MRKNNRYKASMQNRITSNLIAGAFILVVAAVLAFIDWLLGLGFIAW